MLETLVGLGIMDDCYSISTAPRCTATDIANAYDGEPLQYQAIRRLGTPVWFER